MHVNSSCIFIARQLTCTFASNVRRGFKAGILISRAMAQVDVSSQTPMQEVEFFSRLDPLQALGPQVGGWRGKGWCNTGAKLARALH